MMSTLRPRRSWTKRPRSNVVQEVVSSAPSNNSAISTSGNPLKANEASQRDEPLLKSTRKLVGDADELFSRKVPLSDPDVQEIRLKVEDALPRLYKLSQGCSPSHTSAQASFIIHTAEDFLKRFPETAKSGLLRCKSSRDEAQLRQHHSSPAAMASSPRSLEEDAANASSPQAMMFKPGMPDSRLPQLIASNKPGLVPTSTLPTHQKLLQHQSACVQTHARPPITPAYANPSPATPAPVASSGQPASYPGANLPYTPTVSRPPVWASSHDIVSAQNHLHEAAKQTTQQQKMVLFAVHDMLRKRSVRQTNQPWYEPPIGLSPEELISTHGPRDDPRFHGPIFAGHAQQYQPPMQPPQSSAGAYYPFHGNRSVAVGRSLPRSTSLD